jgi:hypothetical protein
MSDSTDLADQIASLRRNIFWSKLIVGLLVLILFCLLASLMRRPAIVEANQLLLKDHNGNVIAKLGDAGYGSTCLTLRAQANGPTSELCVEQHGSYLGLIGPNDSRAILTPGYTTVEPYMRFGPGLYIGENDGQNFVNVSVGAETKMVISHNAKNTVEISSAAGAPALVNLFGSDGKKIWSTKARN